MPGRALSIMAAPCLWAALLLWAGTARAEGPPARLTPAGSVLAADPAAPTRPAPPPASDPGPTPAERVDFACTPTYEETWTYLRRTAAACRHIHVAACGYTTEGRPIPVAFVWESEGPGGAWEDGSGKPVVLITAGIHSGEICGNDALQLLLRDIARGLEPDLTAHLRLILVPILNPDGHVRRAPTHRYTQAGPECGFGRRRNATNLDLNRDYAKLDTPECRALVQLASQFHPHIYMDLHTDDGIGHQYDILYNAAVNPTFPAGRSALAGEQMMPSVEERMAREGFRCRAIAWPEDRGNPGRGFSGYGISTRLGTGYFETRQAICILSEAYPYAPYARRVRATEAFVRAVLAFAVTHRLEVVETVEAARAEVERWAHEPGQHWIGLGCEADTTWSHPVDWLGKKFTVHESAITGESYVLYGDEDTTYTVPMYDRLVPEVVAPMPRGYVLGSEWGEVASKLQSHCIAARQLAAPWEAVVEVFRIGSAIFARDPYQGHHPIEMLDGGWSTERRVFPAGSWWIPLDQPAGLTAMHLLEPESPDGLLRWNSFDSILEEGIVLERWALEQRLNELLADPTFHARYQAALADSTLPRDPEERLLHLFQWTRYAEEEYRVYPAFRCPSEPPAQGGQ